MMLLHEAEIDENHQILIIKKGWLYDSLLYKILIKDSQLFVIDCANKIAAKPYNLKFEQIDEIYLVDPDHPSKIRIVYCFNPWYKNDLIFRKEPTDDELIRRALNS